MGLSFKPVYSGSQEAFLRVQCLAQKGWEGPQSSHAACTL